MIEMTVEMLNAYAAAASRAQGVPVEASASGLAAVLAIVERDMRERRGYASVRLEKARQAAERLLGQEQNHSGTGRDGHLSEADLVPLFEALGAVYLDDPNAQLFVSSDEA